jgi:hypothetical protein
VDKLDRREVEDDSVGLVLLDEVQRSDDRTVALPEHLRAASPDNLRLSRLQLALQEGADCLGRVRF